VGKRSARRRKGGLNNLREIYGSGDHSLKGVRRLAGRGGAEKNVADYKRKPLTTLVPLIDITKRSHVTARNFLKDAERGSLAGCGGARLPRPDLNSSEGRSFPFIWLLLWPQPTAQFFDGLKSTFCKNPEPQMSFNRPQKG
jgi:hypothetical protein